MGFAMTFLGGGVMIAAIYAHMSTRRRRENLAEYLK